MLVRPTSANSRNCGTASIIGGTRTPASRMLNRAVRPGKRYLARANPVRHDSSADRKPPKPAYNALLAIHRQYTPSRYSVSSPMLSNKLVPGQNVKVVNSSEPFLVEATTTQTSGTRQYRVPSSKIPVGSKGVRRSLPGRLRVRVCVVLIFPPGRRRVTAPGAGTRRTGQG